MISASNSVIWIVKPLGLSSPHRHICLYTLLLYLFFCSTTPEQHIFTISSTLSSTDIRPCYKNKMVTFYISYQYFYNICYMTFTLHGYEHALMSRGDDGVITAKEDDRQARDSGLRRCLKSEITVNFWGDVGTLSNSADRTRYFKSKHDANPHKVFFCA